MTCLHSSAAIYMDTDTVSANKYFAFCDRCYLGTLHEMSPKDAALSWWFGLHLQLEVETQPIESTKYISTIPNIEDI